MYGAQKLIPQEAAQQEMIFIPESLVILVLKLARKFEFNSIDVFSLLDTLENTLRRYSKRLGEIDERKMYLLLINIIRISEKFNRASSELTKAKLETIFQDLGLTSNDYNQSEFATFKSMDFKVSTPTVAETIYNLIEVHSDILPRKDSMFEFAMIILRYVYAKKSTIYARSVVLFDSEFVPIVVSIFKFNFRFTKDRKLESQKLMGDQKFLALGVMLLTLRIVCVADRIHNQIFDAVVNELNEEQTASDLNTLSAIIFELVKEENFESEIHLK